MKISVPEYIQSLKPYVAGKPLEELEREYGITDAIKLASNENPLGPSPRAIKAIQQAVSKLNRYPNGGCFDLCDRISERFGIAKECIIIGNGSDDIIAMLARVLLQPGDEAVLPLPSFLFYEIMIRCSGARPVEVPLINNLIDLDGMLSHIGPKTRLVFLTNPHNPTGALIAKDALDKFVVALPESVVLVIDEAYIEFVRDPDCPSCFDYLDSGKMVVGLRTFSKAYGLAGLRIGYGLMPPLLAELLNRVRQPFNVNSLAQAAAVAAFDDEAFLHNTVKLVSDELDFIYDALDNLGIEYLKSQANFLLIKLGKDANGVFEDLLRQGIIVRSMASYGYPDCIRVNVGLHSENVRLLEALPGVLE